MERPSPTLWAISDLHLSFARPDRRERATPRWRDHAARIEREWRAAVARDDLVLLPGDISMARNHRDLQPDLDWLARLPGTKVLSAGNHDAWFNRVEAIRPLLRRSIRAVDGDAIAAGGVILCAPSAPVPPEDPTPEQQSASDHALADLDRALDQATALRTSGEPIYVLWHHPPFDERDAPGPCVERFEATGVTACVYGHLHNEAQWPLAVQGEIRGVRYHCVAADAIGFRPLRIGAIPGS